MAFLDLFKKSHEKLVDVVVDGTGMTEHSAKLGLRGMALSMFFTLAALCAPMATPNASLRSLKDKGPVLPPECLTTSVTSVPVKKLDTVFSSAAKPLSKKEKAKLERAKKDSLMFESDDMAVRMKAFAPLVKEAAKKYKVDANYLMSQLHQESKADRWAIGPKTKYGQAIGPWQFLSSTGAEYGLSTADLHHPKKSTFAAVRYMRQLLNRYGGDYEKACAAYNWGQGNLDGCLSTHGAVWKDHLPGETSDYLKKIFGRLNDQIPVDQKFSVATITLAKKM